MEIAHGHSVLGSRCNILLPASRRDSDLDWIRKASEVDRLRAGSVAVMGRVTDIFHIHESGQ